MIGTLYVFVFGVKYQMKVTVTSYLQVYRKTITPLNGSWRGLVRRRLDLQPEFVIYRTGPRVIATIKPALATRDMPFFNCHL
jgi:hypothetical protein